LLLLEEWYSKLLSVEARTLLHRAKAPLPKAALLYWSAPGLKGDGTPPVLWCPTLKGWHFSVHAPSPCQHIHCWASLEEPTPRAFCPKRPMASLPSFTLFSPVTGDVHRGRTQTYAQTDAPVEWIFSKTFRNTLCVQVF
jgi:hypothetical protein